jgi:nicotinamidase-related amidase
MGKDNKEKFFIVIDMQNDFLTGALKNDDGVQVIGYIKERLEHLDGDTKVIFTRDTHQEDYMTTEEGQNLPVPHCIENTEGWEITEELAEYAAEAKIFNKNTFGSKELAKYFEAYEGEIESVELVGVCTDICVISNALLIKSVLPNAKIYVDAKGCAGVTPESHNTALAAMKACHIHVLNA